jgi:hypothetical protein
MYNDRQLHTVTNALNELRIAIHQSIELGHIPKSNLLTVCKVLTNKINRHCDVAERLLWQASYSEALMILRSAFEATLTMNYLTIHPDEVLDYEYHSLLVSYKDMCLWIKYEFLSPEFKSPIDGKPLQETIEETKHRLLAAKVHERYHIPANKLDDIDYLAKQVKGNFHSIYKLITVLKKADPQVYVDISERSFSIYNEGSQHTHPNYNAAFNFFRDVPGSSSPEGFSYTLTLRSIQYIMLLNVWGLNQIGGIQNLARLKTYFEQVIFSIQSLDSSTDEST